MLRNWQCSYGFTCTFCCVQCSPEHARMKLTYFIYLQLTICRLIKHFTVIYADANKQFLTLNLIFFCREKISLSRTPISLPKIADLPISPYLSPRKYHMYEPHVLRLQEIIFIIWLIWLAINGPNLKKLAPKKNQIGKSSGERKENSGTNPACGTPLLSNWRPDTFNPSTTHWDLFERYDSNQKRGVTPTPILAEAFHDQQHQKLFGGWRILLQQCSRAPDKMHICIFHSNLNVKNSIIFGNVRIMYAKHFPDTQLCHVSKRICFVYILMECGLLPIFP